MGKSLQNIIILTLIFTAVVIVILKLSAPAPPDNQPVTAQAVVEVDRSESSIAAEEVVGEEEVADPSPEESPASVQLGEVSAENRQINTRETESSERHFAVAYEYYEKNDLQKAIFHLNEGLRLEPGNKQAKALLAKLSREAGVEGEFVVKEGSHFIVKYEGGENDVAGHAVAIILEEAYQKVGAELGFHPDDQITAILYTTQQFTDVTRAPSWAGAIFDGKIRLPVGGVRERTDILEKVLYHEYTHAVVYRMGGKGVPTWLNEGIAQYQEGRSDTEDISRALAGADKLIPLRYLEGSFMGLNQQQAQVAYAEGLSVVKYIVDEYGNGMVARLLSEYKAGKGSAEAIKETFHMSYGEFEDAWLKHLRKRYRD